MAQSRRRIEQEPAFVLHTYPYKETSLIVEAFSRRQGRTALLAKGARRPRSALRGVLHAFQPLRLSWAGSGGEQSSTHRWASWRWSSTTRPELLTTQKIGGQYHEGRAGPCVVS